MAGPRGGGQAPDIGRSVNPISTREDTLCPPNYYSPPSPRFSDLPPSLDWCGHFENKLCCSNFGKYVFLEIS